MTHDGGLEMSTNPIWEEVQLGDRGIEKCLDTEAGLLMQCHRRLFLQANTDVHTGFKTEFEGLRTSFPLQLNQEKSH